MRNVQRPFKSGPWSGLAAVLVATAIWGPATAQCADTPRSVAGSASLVPETAAFYGAMVRNREQMEAILHSNAWARLRSLPAVKELIAKGMAEAAKNGGMAKAAEFFSDPQNRQLLQVLHEMGADEIFFYGGRSWIDFIQLAQEFNSFSTRLAMMGPNTNAKQSQKVMMQALIKNRTRLRVPSLVIGFKVETAAAAKEQIARLQKVLDQVTGQIPPLAGRVKRTPVAGSSFLTLNLDGTMVPWDQIPFQDYEEQPGQADELVKSLKAMKLVVGLGVYKNYVMLSVGPSTEVVARLGHGKHVIDRPEMKPVLAFADKPVTSLSYVSKALMASISTNKKDIDGLIAQGENALKMLPLPEDQVKKMSSDLHELGNDLKHYIPVPGAQVGVSFLTPGGQESYDYDYGQHLSLDGSKPLTLLNHVGGSPILAYVSRSKYQPEKYRLVVKWVKKLNDYVNNLVVSNLGDQQKAQYDQVTKIVFPLLKRFNAATENLLPAFKDGQTAFVLDAKIRSKHWAANLETPQALPMLEPAIVCSVSNAEVVRKNFEEYRLILNDAIAKLREVSPQPIPEFEIPPPQTRSLNGGTMYYYPLPPMIQAQIHLDAQLQPNATLGQHILALSISPSQSERLLSPIPLKVSRGPLKDAESRPLAAALYFNWPALVDAAAPWVDYGVRQLVPQMAASSGGMKMDAQKMNSILSQVHTVLEVLKVFRESQSVSYFENGILVTHSVSYVHDLGPEMRAK